MAFMSSKEICKCIRDGTIKIAYYAIKFDQSEARRIDQKVFVKLDADDNDTDLDKAVRDYFLKSLKGDSLYFHVGLYAQVEYLTSMKRRRFRDGKTNIVSLEKMSSLVVASGEHVVISTNEYIEFSDNIGASIYATVSKTDIGFSHISTIIDPLWKGHLQIGMSNVSSQGCTLNYLDNLCSVRFHYLEGEIDKTWKRRETWKHFANNYFDDNRQPKIPISSGDLVNPWRDVSLTRREWEVLRKRAIQGASLALLISTFWAFAKLSLQLQTLDRLADNIRLNEIETKEIEIKLARLQKDVDSLNTRLANIEGIVIASGESRISFSSLSDREEISIPLLSLSSDLLSLRVLFRDISPSHLTYEVILPSEEPNLDSQSESKEATLRVRYIGEIAEGEEILGTVEWLVSQ